MKFVYEWWILHLLWNYAYGIGANSNLLNHGILDKKIIINLKNPLKSLVQSKFSTFPRLTFGLTSIIKAPKLLSDLLTCHSTRFSLTSQPGDCFTLFEHVMSKENGPLVLTQLVNSGLISAGCVCLFNVRIVWAKSELLCYAEAPYLVTSFYLFINQTASKIIDPSVFCWTEHIPGQKLV